MNNSPLIKVFSMLQVLPWWMGISPYWILTCKRSSH